MRSKKYRDLMEGKTPRKGRKAKIAIIVVIILAVVAAAGFAAVKYYLNHTLNKVQRDTKKVTKKELSCVDVDGYVNIALLGVDARNISKKELDDANTDCIIIVSMNEKSKSVNLISVYRDTYTKIGDTSSYNKINSAFASGGSTVAMKTINQTMDLNVQKYVLFNFKMVADLVDAVDGITVNVRPVEVEQLNKYTRESAKIIGRKNYSLVKKAGVQKLEGVQAVSYGRIRKGVGDDFKRTSRMRVVISKVMDKLKKSNLTELNSVMNICLKQCRTNLSNDDMIGLAQRLSSLKIDKSVGFPYKVNTNYLNGVSYVFPADLAANVKKLHAQMFQQEDYQVSSSLQEISNQIAAVAGTYGADSKKLGEDAENSSEEALKTRIGQQAQQTQQQTQPSQ